MLNAAANDSKKQGLLARLNRPPLHRVAFSTKSAGSTVVIDSAAGAQDGPATKQPDSKDRRGVLIRAGYQTTPWSIIALTTLTNPAILAPAT